MLAAALSLWAEAPADALTVRTLVRMAGAAQASIHYHFGDLEHLYAEASAAALSAGEAWMEARLAELDDLAGACLPPTTKAALFAATIADWTVHQRPLAMAARLAPSPGWLTAQERFWNGVALRIGMAECADTLAHFALGETARHLLIWRPVLDRALLEETCAALVLWLSAGELGSDAIRQQHQRCARIAAALPERRHAGATPSIDRAASEVFAQRGFRGLTFRAVAARAGVTLGQVIHACGTKSELLLIALHRLYLREALGDDREGFIAQSFPPRVMLGHLLDAIVSGEQPVLRAYDEIERAIYNGADFHALRGLVRAMEDPSGIWALEQMLSGTRPPASLVAAFSATIRGVGYRVRQLAEPPELARAKAERALGVFLG